MATVIQFKRSSTQNAVPVTSDLSLGEIAVNTYHGRFYTEKNDGSAAIVEVGSNPSSLTINDALVFPTADGSSGQLLSTDGSGNLDFVDAASSALTQFYYSVSSSTQTVFSGSDDNSNTLSYTAGLEGVYLNGIKLVSGSDYVTTSTTVITLQANAVSGDILQVVAQTSVSNLVQGFFSNTSLTATTADQVLSSNSVANKTIKYVIVGKHASLGTHAAEVLLINDGSNAHFVQYGDAFSASSLFSLSSDINSGNMRLLVTPANTNTDFTTFQIRLT
jgi:hypothetical protein|tara:strand:+ start:1733 stop:2560 length:828 start_codon:yes stop_codon:yes gene_type:complete